MGRLVAIAAVAAITLAFGTGAFAQGLQTSTLTGRVMSQDGQPLPGVTVKIGSPALQGDRDMTTDANGNYIFRGLPGGDYTVTFSLAGFATFEQKITVALGTTPNVDSTLTVATVTETVTVTAEAPSQLGTTVVGANYKADNIDKLAMGRTLQNIAELAPGLTDNTPNAGQVTIAGAFAYDNVFLLNGVDINDNLFGSANNLFIEDAIDEVQVLTSGISAEYGRFSGGVVNAVTKRGGNKLFGSFRTDLENPTWQDESKFEKEQIALGRATPHKDTLSKTFQATLGGPIVRDRLWFFVAGRRARTTDPRNLSNSGIPYEFRTQNDRIEAKLTGALNVNHNFNAAYSRNPNNQFSNPSINATFSIDPRTLVDRVLPNDLFVANYNGVLSSNLFVEAQYSRKAFGFRKSGGTSTDIHDSPFLALGRAGIPANRHYNAPYFDSNDPEDRNNQQYTAALSYFLSTGSFGRHDLKLGGERYTSTRTGGNSQSSTSYRFLTDPVVVGGVPIQDANGRFIPTFVPGTTILDNWIAVRGAQIDLNTLSFYVNDRWTLNSRWSFNLGVRFEQHTADTTQAGIVTPESKAIVPRLGVTFDPMGDGKWVLQATYGHYAGKASETQFADNTNVGTPNLVRSIYNGPAGQGVGFEPGFNLANYAVIGGNFPIRNIFLDSGLETPITKEWTLQAGTKLGNKGEIKGVYTNRQTTNFIEDFVTVDLGRTTVVENGRTFGTFDNVRIGNSDLPVREYQALLFNSSYRVTDHWSLAANYTLQIKNEGNFEGELANQPGISSLIGDRPEIYDAQRHFPIGRTDDFQRHKLRVFSTYDLDLGRAGNVILGAVYRYDSPLTFSFAAASVPLTAIQRARGAGYATLPANQGLFFEGRGTAFFEASHLVDLALNYDLPIYRTFRPYVKVDMRNVFNAQPLIGFDTTITANAAGPADSLGLATTFNRGANFGKGTQNGHYPIPREFRFSVGFRF